MKKILLLLLIIISSDYSFSQSGSGTLADPYYGIISTTVTWDPDDYTNGEVYVGSTTSGQDLTVDGGHLTILPGTKIIFMLAGSDLIITGTGRLTATGTSSDRIIFTRYYPANINWGHISFQNMGAAESSIIDYCIIEYGDVRNAGTSENPYRYGGAIHAAITNLTVSNCILQNNKAKWGGALFVNKNYSPTIKNCFISNNSSDHAGGGFYFWDGSASIVENCIFEANACLESSIDYYSGGGLCSQRGTSIKVVNCTFVNNTTTRPTGASIELFQSTNDAVLNCICWGSGTHFYKSGTNVVQYCAVQGTLPTGTGNFQISADNSLSNGPNFNTTDGSDWSIKYISPCRDAGTSSYGSPNIVPPTDIIHNSRTLTTDIGAYEVQYSRWKTTASSTDWGTTGNWDGGVPTSAKDVIIPAGATNYPTASPGPNFTIGAGKQLIIESGASATLNSLTNNGIIKLNHNSTDFASLILTNYTRGSGGTEEIQLYLAGGGTEGPPADYKWHYISIPVSSLSTDVFTVNTYNLAQFIESRPSLSLAQGWVAYDGYVYSGGSGPTFNTLTPGKGYNYFNDVDNTYSFGGLFNTLNVAVSLSYTTGTPASMHGFNLLGNPFSSGLNWDDIIDGIYSPYPANTSKGLYFTRDNEQCSYIAGVGVPSDVNGIIPPMQGFFNKTSAAGNSITLSAAARTHNIIHSRYKGEIIIPLVRLSIFENQISNDETVVRFNNLAKSDLDNDYDAIKMFFSSNKTSIHTSMGGTDYAINGQPFPGPSLEIPVVVNVVSAGTHKISATQLQGLDNYSVSLTDKTTGFTANLKTTPDVTFSASAGILRDRFTLTISNASTGTEDRFTAYESFNKFNIQTLADEWDGQTGSVKVLDISGKTVSELRNAGFSKSSITQLQAPGTNGLYFIEIRSGMKKYVGKVVVR